MTERVNKFYPLKVLALTLVVAPLLMFVEFMFCKGVIGEGGGIIVFMWIFILMGCMYSLPTLLICHFAFCFISTRIQNEFKLKAFFISLAMVLLTITNYVIWGKYKYDIHNDNSGIVSTIAYCLSVLIFGILCKTKSPIEPVSLVEKKPWEHF